MLHLIFALLAGVASASTNTFTPTTTTTATRTATITQTPTRTPTALGSVPFNPAQVVVPGAFDPATKLVVPAQTMFPFPVLVIGGVAPAPNLSPVPVQTVYAIKPVPTSTAIYYSVTCDLTPVSLGTPDAGRWTMRIVPDGGTRIDYASTAALAISDGQPLTNLVGNTLERDDGCTQQIFVVSHDGTPVAVRVKVVRLP